MKVPRINQAPRIVFDLPENHLDCFREGWAAGQLHMLERFLKKHEGIEIDSEDRRIIYDMILNGRKQR